MYLKALFPNYHTSWDTFFKFFSELWRRANAQNVSFLKWYYDKNRHFNKTQKSSLHKKQNAVYYFQISLFVPEILKYAN